MLSGAARPVTFGGLPGWYRPGDRARGVLLCGTIGYEQVSAYRRWVALADRIADRGCAVLRFDYPGEGDAPDVADRSAALFVDAIAQGAAWLREAAGVAEVALVGLRLGATLAALAGPRVAAERVALIAPFATGRAYDREMTLQARTLGRLADGSPMPQGAHLNVGGFAHARDVAASLAAIDLTRAPAPAPRILIAGGAADALAAAWRAGGATVETLPVPDLAELFAGPLVVAEPAALDAVAAFAAEGARPGPRTREGHAAPIAGAGWTESVVTPGDVVGVACRPAAGAPRAALLLLNSGRNVRSGWGRQATRFARVLAAEGVASLRIDLPGIGDGPGAPPADLFDPGVVRHLAPVLDLLARDGVPIVAAGVCSGAVLGWRLARADARIDAALLMNPPWLEADGGAVASTRKGFRSTGTYWRLLGRGEAWRRLVSGQVRIGAIGAMLARRAIAAMRRRAGAAAATTIAPVPAEAARLRARGCRIGLLFSEGDPGIEVVRFEFGMAPAAIAAATGGPWRIVAGTDHNLGGETGDAAMLDAIRAMLSLVAPAPAVSAPILVS